MIHLRSKQEYVELYDRATIEDCRRRENFHKNYKPPEEEAKKGSKKFFEGIAEMCIHYDLLFTTLDWWEKKEKAVQGWIDADAHKDEMLEQAVAPKGIRCLKCSSPVASNEKYIRDWDDKPMRVLFMYTCPKGCLPHRSLFSDGEEYRRKPHLCPKCDTELSRTHEKVEGEKVIMTDTCPKCGHSVVDEMDLTVKKWQPDADYEKDRTRFCLSEEAARKNLEEKRQLENIKQLVDKWKERDKHKEDYEAVKKMQKLTVIELEALLTPAVEAAGFVKLQFGTPEIGKDVFLPFTAHDAQSGRNEWDSSHALRKLVRKALEGTNWRLMMEGISYRLGILTGRLRAYEREEDLLTLVRKKEHDEKGTGDDRNASTSDIED